MSEEKAMMRAMCGIQLKVLNTKHLMLMENFNEAMDRFTMANSVY